MTHAAPASLLTIFGATGDLSRRMLLPSLYSLQAEQLLPANLRILGTARSELDREGFANLVSTSIAERIPGAERNDAALRGLLDRLDYAAASVDDDASMAALAARVESLRDGDVLYHMSTAPKFYGPACQALAAHGAAGAGTRVMLEKPIGQDLASAIAINDSVAAAFDEERMFRIDHYLGKEGVQNLIALRFGNTMFEPLWNARTSTTCRSPSARPSASTTAGPTTTSTARCATCCRTTCCSCCAWWRWSRRRDLDPNSVRNEKVKVLRSLRPIGATRSPTSHRARPVRRRRHRRQARCPAMTRNAAAAADTETFVAIRADIDNWRWAGVPFFLRTGKRLPERAPRSSSSSSRCRTRSSAVAPPATCSQPPGHRAAARGRHLAAADEQDAGPGPQRPAAVAGRA